MKKSKMLELIEDKILYDWRCDAYVGSAQEILQLVEEFGMLPPEVETEEGSMWEVFEFDYDLKISDVHKWEDEE